jgi:hypothetical protein
MSKVNHRAKLAELRALRQAGKKAFDNYQVAEVADLYDEVDEDGYKKIVRDRLNQDDFVVDDNGEGYADDGREEWDRVRRNESDSEGDEADAPRRGRPSKSGSCTLHTMSTCLSFLTTVQPRTLARKSRQSAMPTTEASAIISPRVWARPRQSPR